ncbi:MAG: metallophosphoesterase [Treponema sp.]|nr:metallophosphoesterase [Treponema sp.]
MQTDNKKLLALSDSHGDIRTLISIFNWAKSYMIDTIIFLGDGILDLPRAQAEAGFFCDVHAVRGNGDFVASIPEAAIFDFYDHRFFLCHGHRYSLYNGFNTLIAIAHNNGADAALFGHTHVPYCKKQNDILLLNPGSISRPRSNTGATFAVIECLPELKINFWNIGEDGITEAKKIKR